VWSILVLVKLQLLKYDDDKEEVGVWYFELVVNQGGSSERSVGEMG